MDKVNSRTTKTQRHTRNRKKVVVHADRPRLSIHRSNHYVYAQIVDINGKTLLGLSDKALLAKKVAPMDRAKQLGTEVAKKAKEQKINAVVFDKGSLAYHGRVKALAEGAREGGLQF